MLSIDWTAAQLRIVEGKASGAGVALRRSVSVAIPQDLDVADARAMGEFLRERLAESRIADRQAVSGLDRRFLVLKTVPLADVGDDEVPEVVRLQAMRDLTLSIEEIAYDFVRLEPAGPGGEPYALLAAAKREIVESVRQVFAVADLKLAGLWPSSLARTHAVAVCVTDWDQPAVGGLQLLIVPDGESAELILLEDGRFVASVSRPMGRPTVEGLSANPLLQAVRRMQASLATQYPSLAIDQIAVAGFAGIDGALVEELAGHFEAKLVHFDPLAALAGCTVPAAERGAFAGTVGALGLAGVPAKERINFLAPKRTVIKPDRRRLAAIGLLGLLALGGMQTMQHVRREGARLEKSSSDVKTRERVLATELKQLRAAEAQAAVLDSWLAGDVVWLDVLCELVAAAPERLVLTSIALSDAVRGSQVGLVRLEGHSASQKSVAEFSRRLHATGRFEMRTGPIQPARGAGNLPWQFSADVAVLVTEEENP